MMKVLRIENHLKRGIYEYARQAEMACRAYLYQGRAGCQILHPEPEEDELLRDKWKSMPFKESSMYFFGFKDKNQLLDWFPYEGLKRLKQVFTVNMFHNIHAQTFCINEYEVPDNYVIIGDKQVVFRLDCANLIHSYNLDDEAFKYES